MVRFIVIVTGYNCSKYVEACYNSIRDQTYENFACAFVSDGSTDTTEFTINKVVRDPRFVKVIHKKNEGAAKRRYEALQNLGDKKHVVVLVGMDDRLMPNALERIAQEYEKGVWMTYGNWIDQNGEGLPEDFDLDFCDTTHAERSYRKVKYRSTAPNTFYKFLFDRIPVNDFRLNSKWIDSTTESEVMFSCLEMCGKDRIGIIREPIYIYNRNLPNGTLKRLGKDYKYRIYNEIIKRPKRQLLTDNDFGK